MTSAAVSAHFMNEISVSLHFYTLSLPQQPHVRLRTLSYRQQTRPHELLLHLATQAPAVCFVHAEESELCLLQDIKMNTPSGAGSICDCVYKV